MKVSRRGPQSFRVFLGSSHVDVVARKLNDGGLLVQVRHSTGLPYWSSNKFLFCHLPCLRLHMLCLISQNKTFPAECT